VKLLSYIHCCCRFLFALSFINLLLSLTSPRFYEALTSIVIAKNSVFLLLCSGQVNLSISLLHLLKLWDFLIVVTFERGQLFLIL
jgi:hypothetical protein